jgi:hypothetical protein
MSQSFDIARLEQTYARVRDRLGQERSECFEAAVVVERLRSIWRPDPARIALLAESHVWTSRDEALSRVQQPDGVVTGFARFIYCLGVGEPTLVTPSVAPNAGASQYWKLLHDTVRGPSQPHAGLMKSGEQDADRRIVNKLELLRTVRNAGIWLVDASISALYHAGARLAAGDTYDGLLRDCWNSYVGDIVCASAPSLVIVIGRQVNGAIGAALQRDLGKSVEVRVIHQPNARMTGPQLAQYRQQIFDLCRVR